MPVQFHLSDKARKQLKKLRIEKQFEKQKHLFLSNPLHPSLDFKKLKGANEGFYAFRINDQYRARFVKLDCFCSYNWLIIKNNYRRLDQVPRQFTSNFLDYFTAIDVLTVTDPGDPSVQPNFVNTLPQSITASKPFISPQLENAIKHLRPKQK